MSLKTAGIREFARMIGRSHSWVVSQCQRNTIPKTTDGKIPVDEALKAVARLFAAVRARVREGRIRRHRARAHCLCYAVGMSDALPGVAIRQAAKQSSRLAAASLFQHIESGRRDERCLIYPGRTCGLSHGLRPASGRSSRMSWRVICRCLMRLA